jgi:biopolymer transport protein ExbD
MIDVMLLMLVFYILSTVTLTHQHGIPVDLPRASTGSSAEGSEVTITINKDGEFFVNKDKVRQEDLAATVKALADKTPGGIKALDDKGVVINADLSVQHRLVVYCMDAMRGIDVTHFSVSTESSGAPH